MVPVPPESQNILFVTDVPFWRGQTGAQFRIGNLVAGLHQAPFQASVLITHPDTSDASVPARWEPLEREVNFCNRETNPTGPFPAEIPVDQLRLDRPPEFGFIARCRWRWDGLIHAIQKNLGTSDRDTQPIRPRTIENYYDAATIRRFVNYVSHTRPSIIVFEYLTQTQLLRSLPDHLRKETTCVLDAHDVLHRRTSAFAEHGYSHWVDVSPEMEESAVADYDLIIAIQPEEANYFATVVGQSKVITTGIELEPVSNPTGKTAVPPGDGLSIGYLASDNGANFEAIKEIVSHWSTIRKCCPEHRLVIAGGIVDRCIDAQFDSKAGIMMLGKVDAVSSFYQCIDVVWNPVKFGTGLKIKNIEAMSFGKALLTTRHGASGLKTAWETGAILVADEKQQYLEILTQSPKSHFHDVGKKGRKYQEKNFGKGTQFPLLRQKLESLCSQ